MDYKEENKKAYDKFAEIFEDNTKEYLQNHLLEDVTLFIQNLQGKRLLDVGSGPGRDSLFFKNKGLNPVCIDISSSMVELCKKKGLEAHEMDLENIEFDESSYIVVESFVMVYRSCVTLRIGADDSYLWIVVCVRSISDSLPHDA